MKQQRDVDSESARNLIDGVDGRIPDAALDLADELVADSGALAESFLRPPALLPQS